MDRRSDSPAAGRRLSPAAVALLYAAFAVLWIVASGALLTLSVADAALQEKIELGKGLLFVAVSASLLYLVLKYWISPLPEVPVTPRVPGRPGADRRWRVPLLLLVPLAGYVVYRVHGPQIERDAFASLEAIAELKAGQLENWFDERRNDGDVIASSTGLSAQVAALQHRPGAALLAEVRSRLTAVTGALKYDGFLLVDPYGATLAHVGPVRRLSPGAAAKLTLALASDQTVVSDIVANGGERSPLEFIVPLRLSGHG